MECGDCLESLEHKLREASAGPGQEMLPKVQSDISASVKIKTLRVPVPVQGQVQGKVEAQVIVQVQV